MNPTESYAAQHANPVGLRQTLGAVEGLSRFTVLVLRPSGGGVFRSGRLTPYSAQTLTTEALRADPGSELLLNFSPGTPDDEIDGMVRCLECLRDRGVRVTVSRGDEAIQSLRKEPTQSEPPRAA